MPDPWCKASSSSAAGKISQSLSRVRHQPSFLCHWNDLDPASIARKAISKFWDYNYDYDYDLLFKRLRSYIKDSLKKQLNEPNHIHDVDVWITYTFVCFYVWLWITCMSVCLCLCLSLWLCLSVCLSVLFERFIIYSTCQTTYLGNNL